MILQSKEKVPSQVYARGIWQIDSSEAVSNMNVARAIAQIQSTEYLYRAYMGR